MYFFLEFLKLIKNRQDHSLGCTGCIASFELNIQSERFTAVQKLIEMNLDFRVKDYKVTVIL